MKYGWEDFARDFSEQPLMAPVFNLYNRFMDIKRGERAPFYVFPYSDKFNASAGTFLKVLPYFMDAHQPDIYKND